MTDINDLANKLGVPPEDIHEYYRIPYDALPIMWIQRYVAATPTKD